METKNPLSQYTLLYVEDNIEISEEISYFLEPRVKVLYSGKNGKEGLTLFQEYKPDIIITDIQMPIMDGIEMISEIRKLDSKVPILITTAFNESDYLMKAIDLRVDSYVMKPTNIKDLLNRLEKIIQPIELQKQILNKNNELEVQNNELISAYNKLKVTQKGFFDIFYQAPIAHLLITKDFCISKANQQASILFGLSNKKDVVTFHSLVSSDDMNTFTQWVSSKDNASLEIQLKGINKPFHSKIDKSTIINENEEQTLLIINDATHEYEVRTTLEKTIDKQCENISKKDKMFLEQSKMALMGDMVGIITHHWMQPLNVISIILGNVDIRYKTGKLEETYMNEATEEMKEQITYMSHTIDDFRKFFSQNKNKDSFIIQHSIGKTLKIIDTVLRQNDISVSVLGENALLNNYENEFRQVIINILSNSKDALIENNIKDKKIVITIDKEDSKTIIKICDNAGGLSQDVIDHLFEPSFTTKGMDGTGVGLYLVKMILEDSMNGKIEAYNNDEGACFKLIFE